MNESLSISKLPPYGFINSEWMVGLGTAVPPGFELHGSPATVSQFRAWVADLASEIAENLWPMFDRPSGTWRGGAAETAIALTEADLELLEPLRLHLTSPIEARGVGAMHREFFDEEDGFVIDVAATPPSFRPVGSSYAKYDDLLPPGIVLKIRTAFRGDGIKASGELDLQLKQYLQRPRAFQVAALFGRNAYTYQWAKSAVSPSLVSGHALQASIAGCYAYLACKTDLSNTQDSVRYWSQFTVDMGDRRVFAGVHYPSDNLASWFTALRLAPHIFASQASDARNFLWQAISQRSAVYAAMKEASESEPFSPYVKPLQWLSDEASR